MDAEKPKEITVLDMDVELQVYDKVSAAVEQAKIRCANIVLSYDTPQDIKEAKSFIYQNLRKLKTSITEVHKIQCAQLIKDKKACDAVKKKLHGVVEEMIEEKYAPIRKIEEAETIRLAEEKLKKEQEEAAIEQARLDKIKEAEAAVAARERELAEAEAKVKAEKEKLEREARERQIAEDAKKQAAEDAKQAVIDAENAKKAAEERVKQEAVNAENARKQAVVDADNAKAAAVQKAKDEAAAEAAEKERLAAETAEKDRMYQLELESQEQERIADKEHRRKIHRDILGILTGMGMEEGFAKAVIIAISQGGINHVTINY